MKGMSTLAGPVHSTAFVVSGTDNPIPLVDWISSFVQTLGKFNGVVDKIATVSITLFPCKLVHDCSMSRFILTPKQRGPSSRLFPRSGHLRSVVARSNLRVADIY